MKHLAAHLIGVLGTVALGVVPMAAQAAESFYVCRDEQGKVEYLTINLAQKKATMISGTAPYRCLSTLRDGVNGEVVTSYRGDSCTLLVLFGHPEGQQYFRLNGHVVSFGYRSNTGGSAAFTFDMETGVLDTGHGFETCRRPHA